MSVELATGYVTVTATAKGIQQSISKEFTGADKVAADAGKNAGDQFSDKFAQGATSGNKVAASSRELGTKLAKGLVIAGAAISVFAVKAANSFTESAFAARNFQRIVGGTVEDGSRLLFLFKRLSVDPDAASAALSRLSRNIANGAVDLAKYGVTVQKNADGSINMKKAIVDLAGAFSKLNANDRQQAIFEVFGRGGKALLPVLAQTKGSLEDIFALAAKDHQVFTDDDLKKADDYKKGVAELNAAWGGLQAELGRAVIPILKGVTAVLTPLAQALADNAGALTTFGQVAGGPVLVAIGALYATQKALDFAPAARSIKDFGSNLLDMARGSTGAAEAAATVSSASRIAAVDIAAGAEAARVAQAAEVGLGAAATTAGDEIAAAGVTAKAGWAGLLGPALGIAAIVAGTYVLARAFGLLDDQQSRVQQNAPKWAQAEVAASLRASGSLKGAKARLSDIGDELDKLKKIRDSGDSDFFSFDTLKSAFNLRNQTDSTTLAMRQQLGVTDHLGSRIKDLEARETALGNTLDLLAPKHGKVVKATEDQQQIATALSETLGDAIANNNTYAATQDRLALAVAVAADAGVAGTAKYKAAQKELQDALNASANAQERMNLAVIASVNSGLAFQQGAKSLAEQVKHLNDGTDASVDSLTFQQSAMAQAALAAKVFGDAQEVAGKGPLSAAQSLDVQKQALIDIQRQYPQTAGAVQPLIDQINGLQLAAWIAAHTPADPHVSTPGLPEAQAGLAGLQGQLNALNGKHFVTFVDLVAPKSVDLNFDGTPNRDFNKFTGGGRALGGSVLAGTLYTVNERGDEAFLPAVNGRILSHDDSMAALAAGSGRGGDVNVIINGVSYLDGGAADRLAAQVAQHMNRNGRTVSRLTAGR